MWGLYARFNLFKDTGLAPEHPEVNFVMGVASGMPVDARLLELLSQYAPSDAVWQTTLIGRQEIWPVHRRTAELGGNLRTGVEDTFYLPNGEKCRGNGDLIEALVATAREAGREIASPSEARAPAPFELSHHKPSTSVSSDGKRPLQTKGGSS